MSLSSSEKRIVRHNRIRSRISGTSVCPRLSVYRSNASIYAQLIDDVSGVTLTSASDLTTKKGTKIERAHEVWLAIAASASKLWIKKCIFDRGWFLYTWRVSALADAAREWGLQF